MGGGGGGGGGGGSEYETNYSYSFRGGSCGVLQRCNVLAHKIIYACIIDFRPTLTYQSTSADLRQQRSTIFYFFLFAARSVSFD